MSCIERYIVAFDLDDVLCVRDSQEGGVEKYATCRPVKEMIDVCNRLFDDGCHIIIYTARGMNVFRNDVDAVHANLFVMTRDQLDSWGVRYHELVMGKRHFDMLIDDKAISSFTVLEAEDVYTAIASSLGAAQALRVRQKGHMRDSITIDWSEEHGSYVARIPALDVNAYGATASGALEAAQLIRSRRQC